MTSWIQNLHYLLSRLCMAYWVWVLGSPGSLLTVFYLELSRQASHHRRKEADRVCKDLQSKLQMQGFEHWKRMRGWTQWLSRSLQTYLSSEIESCGSQPAQVQCPFSMANFQKTLVLCWDGSEGNKSILLILKDQCPKCSKLMCFAICKCMAQLLWKSQGGTALSLNMCQSLCWPYHQCLATW
jgi:hypothetical protein